MANSSIENGYVSSPLEDLLLYSYALDILIIILLICLFILIFNRYILSFNINYITKILNKYLPNKYGEWINNKINSSKNLNNKFVLVMFIIYSILLIILLILKLYLISELYLNIDSYVDVHKYVHLKKGGLLLTFAFRTDHSTLPSVRNGRSLKVIYKNNKFNNLSPCIPYVSLNHHHFKGYTSITNNKFNTDPCLDLLSKNHYPDPYPPLLN